MSIAEQLDYRGLRIRIEYDECPESPREWNNFGRMVCWHSRYVLGDTDRSASGHHYASSHDGEIFNSPQDFMDWWKANGKGGILIPLYLYDHSGISISCGREYPFNCPWDSGQVGWVYATAEMIRKEFGKRITKARRAQAEKCIRSEVETYDTFLTGQVYGYIVERPELDDDGEETGEAEELDSCWGMFGMDYCIQEAKSVADHYADEADRAGLIEGQYA